MLWTHTPGRSQPLLSERHGYMAVKTDASANSGAICALQRRETAAEAAASRRSKPASATPPMFHAPPAAPKSLAAPNTRIRPQVRVGTWKSVAMVIKFDRIVHTKHHTNFTCTSYYFIVDFECHMNKGLQFPLIILSE